MEKPLLEGFGRGLRMVEKEKTAKAKVAKPKAVAEKVILVLTRLLVSRSGLNL